MKSVRKQWVLDVQWSDAPEEVEKEAHRIWIEDGRLSNDVCIYKWCDECDWSFDERNPIWQRNLQYFQDNPEKEQSMEKTKSSYPAIENWLLEQGVPFGEEVWIHWWW